MDPSGTFAYQMDPRLYLGFPIPDLIIKSALKKETNQILIFLKLLTLFVRIAAFQYVIQVIILKYTISLTYLNEYTVPTFII